MTPTGRPDFARDFPREPAVEALVDAFARGDYARVRLDAARLVTSAESKDVRDAGRTLLARTRPDPLAVMLLAMTGALLALLAMYWVVHGKPPTGTIRSAPPPAPVEQLR